MRKAFNTQRFGNEWVSQEMDAEDLPEIVSEMNSIVWFCLKLIFWPITLAYYIWVDVSAWRKRR